MGKAKRRSLNQGINNKFQYMTRESALESVVKNLDKKVDIIDTITLFGFTAEEMLSVTPMGPESWLIPNSPLMISPRECQTSFTKDHVQRKE